VDASDNLFFIRGTLAGGLLKFTVVSRLPSGRRGAVPGNEFFEAMMASFRARVTRIEGHWVAGIDLDTNIDQFNYWTGPSGGNTPDQEAARRTWTGRQAARHRFGKVTIIFKDPPNAPGNYIEVIAHFAK
jgi:hypothetical protein